MKKALTPAARSFVAAGLLIVPVAAELVVAAVGDHLTGLLVFAAAQLAAWLLLATVCLRLLAACQPSARPGRVGARMVLAGCVSQMLFAAQYAAAAIAANGDPEIPFALFLLGFLADDGRRSALGDEPATRRARARRMGIAGGCRARLPGDGRRRQPVPRRLPARELRLLGSRRRRNPRGRARHPGRHTKWSLQQPERMTCRAQQAGSSPPPRSGPMPSSPAEANEAWAPGRVTA